MWLVTVQHTHGCASTAGETLRRDDGLAGSPCSQGVSSRCFALQFLVAKSLVAHTGRRTTRGRTPPRMVVKRSHENPRCVVVVPPACKKALVLPHVPLCRRPQRRCRFARVLRLLHVPMTHGVEFPGTWFHLGPVHGHVPEVYPTDPLRQQDRLLEQLRQRALMLPAARMDRPMVRLPISAAHAHEDMLPEHPWISCSAGFSAGATPPRRPRGPRHPSQR